MRRLASRLRGVSTLTPPADTSTTAMSWPTSTRTTSAVAPPRTAGAVPVSRPPSSASVPVTVAAPVSSPEARPGRNRARQVSSPAATRAALAITVGTKAPGMRARPASSTTTTSSSTPKPEPPSASGTCNPSQPMSTMSVHNSGRDSVSAACWARAAAREPRLFNISAAVWARARWSSVMAIDMAVDRSPLARVRRCPQLSHPWTPWRSTSSRPARWCPDFRSTSRAGPARGGGRFLRPTIGHSSPR